jgi:hypothetical protein
MATHTIYNTTTIRDYLGFYQPPREYIYFLIVLKGSQPNTSHNKDLIARVYVSPSHLILKRTTSTIRKRDRGYDIVYIKKNLHCKL